MASSAVAWLLHAMMLIATFLAIFFLGAFPTDSSIEPIVYGVTLLVAVAAASAAGFLLAATGSVLAQDVTGFAEYGSERRFGGKPPGEALPLALAIGIGGGAYGVLGLTVQYISSTSSSVALPDIIHTLGVLWLLASLLLVLAAVAWRALLKHFPSPAMDVKGRSGYWFMVYAVLNAVSVAGFLVAITVLLAGAPPSSEVDLIPLYLATASVFLVVPAIGIVAFGRMFWLGLAFWGITRRSMPQPRPLWVPSSPGSSAVSPAPNVPWITREERVKPPSRPSTPWPSTDSEVGLRLRELTAGLARQQEILDRLNWRLTNGLITKAVYDSFAEPVLRRIERLREESARLSQRTSGEN